MSYALVVYSVSALNKRGRTSCGIVGLHVGESNSVQVRIQSGVYNAYRVVGYLYMRRTAHIVMHAKQDGIICKRASHQLHQNSSPPPQRASVQHIP